MATDRVAVGHAVSTKLAGRSSTMRGTGLIAVLTFALAAAIPAFAADDPNEQVTTKPLPPATPQRIYLGDFTINHVMDGRLNVIDGRSMKLLGIVATGFAGLP